MSIDLHCHTRYSDGSTPLEELIQLAALRGVTTFALTDHDTMAVSYTHLTLPTTSRV